MKTYLVTACNERRGVYQFTLRGKSASDVYASCMRLGRGNWDIKSVELA